MNRAKLARVSLDPQRDAVVEFSVGGLDIEAALVEPGDESSPRLVDSLIGIHEEIDSDGDRHRQFMRIPRRLGEAQRTVVEVYDNRQNLVQGVGAVAVASGAVETGSLFVHSFK